MVILRNFHFCPKGSSATNDQSSWKWINKYIQDRSKLFKGNQNKK